MHCTNVVIQQSQQHGQQQSQQDLVLIKARTVEAGLPRDFVVGNMLPTCKKTVNNHVIYAQNQQHGQLHGQLHHALTQITIVAVGRQADFVTMLPMYLT